MTIYVYGKNVVKGLLNDHKKIYEIVMSEGLKDQELMNLDVYKRQSVSSV